MFSQSFRLNGATLWELTGPSKFAKKLESLVVTVVLAQVFFVRHLLKLRIREECNEPSIDINKIIRHRRFKWLGQILRLEKDKEKTRLLKLAVTQMKKPYPAGSILMDAPEHSSMDQLIDYAHDVDRWAVWANAILDPNHA